MGKAAYALLPVIFFAIAVPFKTYSPAGAETGQPYIVDEGDLPGVTWADDVHPIFIRNKCGLCHTRGRELYVDELKEFALGLIDQKNSKNAYHSYHELVYAEGKPQVQGGEELRDGQCCWPSGYAAPKQRRIWVGHAERSAIMHKLDRDYYDWDRPPRFVEEGLRLRWGLPMPWVEPERGVSEYNHKHIEVRNFLKQALIYLKIWLGAGDGEILELPPGIPSRDRTLLRYWIESAIQVESEGTAMEVRAVDRKGNPVEGAAVFFVGNFNNRQRREVYDKFALKTGGDGASRLEFPKESVITSFWFVRAEKDGKESGYVPVKVIHGKSLEVLLIIP